MGHVRPGHVRLPQVAVLTQSTHLGARTEEHSNLIGSHLHKFTPRQKQCIDPFCVLPTHLTSFAHGLRVRRAACHLIW